MLALFIVALLVASQFMKDEAVLNENMTVAIEVQNQNIDRP
ncbi:hypothetical protein CLV90_0582 [Maribacter spongiicola]|uniref:Uncharacterized protein n=1 Tax=Maribacter spongiicola TaxID=1206753 RepID=A0A4R7K7Y3_9FLAO|nr:hypothetical protein [Maribacter spongiicola]TDT46528.1 hypothetical protein CLV90_0582 [Maribacter spongiicola]